MKKYKRYFKVENEQGISYGKLESDLPFSKEEGIAHFLAKDKNSKVECISHKLGERMSVLKKLPIE